MAPKRDPKSDQKMVHKIIKKLVKNVQLYVQLLGSMMKKNRSDRNLFGVIFYKFEDVPKMVSKLFKIASNSLR